MNIREQYQKQAEALALELVTNDTCKDVGDFGGLQGLINWLTDSDYPEHAALLKNVFKL